MIKEMIIMAQVGGFSGLSDFRQIMQDYGVFELALPFLLLFALIFGILRRIDLFKDNKGVDGIISLAVALMALQFDFVNQFFAEVFPSFGIGLAILLILLILTGLFIPYEQTWVSYVYLGVSAIVVLVILIDSASVLNWTGASWFYENWGFLAVLIVGLIAIAIIMGASSKEPGNHSSVLTNFLKAAAGDKP